MRISDRYLGYQIFIGTIMSVILLLVILVMGTLFKEVRDLLVTYQAPLGLLIKYLFLKMPYPVMYALPWGFLVTVLLTFGRLSSQNELVGFRSSGVSLARLSLPVFGLGFFFSALCLFMAGTLSPKAKLNARKLIDVALKQDPTSLLASNSETKLPKYQAYVTSKKGSTLKGFHLYSLSSVERDATLETYVYAESVDLEVDQENSQFNLSFENAFIEKFSQNETGESGPSEIITSSTAEPWPVAFPSKGIPNKPGYLSNVSLFAEAAKGMSEPKIADESLTALEREEKEERFNKVITELQMRHALSLACFSFAFIAIPLGISSRRRETSSGLVNSLVIAGVYFALLTLAENFESQPLLCSVLMWLPNLLCIGLGLFLMKRASFR